MTDIKHTPGPWTIENHTIQDGLGGIKYSNIYKGKNVIAKCINWSPRHEANARLIAAAPDLLEACESGLKEIESLADFYVNPASQITESVIKTLKQAIAKAKP